MNAADDRVPLVFEDTASARDVFLAWEKLRLVYNAALVLATALAVGFGQPFRRVDVDRAFLAHLGEGAAILNVAFCAGPVLESYMAWMGAPRSAFRLALFTPGCLFAMLWVFSSIGSFLLRHP